jgi:uncharacterized protein (TIGR03435 family)
MLTEAVVGTLARTAIVKAALASALSGAALLLVVVFPVVPAQAQQASNAAAPIEQRPTFEVATIKPSKPDDRGESLRSGMDRLDIENFTLRRLIRTAYGLKSESQVLGGPDWIGKQSFDIAAKFDEAEIARLRTMKGRERFQETRLALQALLADRFQLHVRRETRSIPVYALFVAKSGAKLPASVPQVDESGKPRTDKGHGLDNNNGHLTATAISMSAFADWFAYLPECDRVVVDRTGLSGEYDFKLNWTPDDGQGIASDATLPGLFTALREQLGLELKPDKAPVDVVVAESAKEPEVD